MEARRFTPEPVRSVLRAFFCRDLALRLDSGRPRLKLADADDAMRTPAAAAPADAQLALMREELAALLDAQPGARQVLRHLAVFEAAFRRHGPAVLERAPLGLLRAALEQFEGLVSNWSPVGLATLRSKMAVALIERDEDDGAGARAGAGAPDFCASTLPLQLDREAKLPGVEVRCDDAEVAAVYRAMGLAGAGTA